MKALLSLSRRPSRLLMGGTALAGLVATSLAATPALAAEAVDKPAPVADLVKAVNIPYDRFTLPNGLTVLVHTDRKAPVVAVSVWYAVGSKNEPRGRTGFAHLFEHLMFYGSEHVSGNFFAPLSEVGATDMNGTTWLDRTNYFETVPTGALDRALMMESDRMGYLLPAMTQARLDAQRAVVKNEKRQGDNQPFGLVDYEKLETLYPAGNPYHHSTIGSMDDLDKASLDDVKGWFRDHYGPNNAVLVLAGDIDLATAKDKVTHWFGSIPAGPKVQPVKVPIVPLKAPVEKTIHDSVATTRVYRMWAVPGLDNPQYLPLSIGATILGGLASSRLDDALVRGRQIAIATEANTETFAQGAQFVVSADVKPGQDAKVVGAALDAEIARLIAQGPTADELQRATMAYVSTQIRALESVGGNSGKAPTLAEGLLYSGDPAHYRTELEAAAKVTAADVQAAMKTWLSHPVFALTVEPGTRTAGGENRGGDDALPPAQPAPPVANTAATTPSADRSTLPAAGDIPPLPFPAIERATLSNGIKVYFARRSAVPTVAVRVAFDAGYAADPVGAPGTEALLLKLMDEGTEKLDAIELARARERLGAAITAYSGPDQTGFQLDALDANLAPSLSLLSDFVRHPGLRDKDFARVKDQQLAAIDAEGQDPDGAALRVLYPALYGPGHPYGTAPSGIGTRAAVTAMTRDTLAAWHQAWLRPDRASIFVVGDTTLDAMKPMLEKSFGSWKVPVSAAPVKNFAVAVPQPRARILLVDRPGVPQAQIEAGELLDAKGTDDLVNLRTANQVLGGDFLARLTSNLREDKGWSYGVYSMIGQREQQVAFRIYAPVQTDKAGPAIAELRKEVTGYLGTSGTKPVELGWAATGSARKLPGMFETSGGLLEGIAGIIQFKRPDDWYTRLPERYRALTTTDLDKAARAKLDPSHLMWVVVGDAAKIRPQLQDLGLPVDEVKATD
ncbi:M16 family metallopeptidase [Novosphingobium nitrogenifigens]|nr:pitrilysin family protein [Novosphingobium nitrogenifigens]